MHTGKNEIVVGVIVIIAIIVIIAGSIFFTSYSVNKEQYYITAVFPQIGGLSVGNAVFVNGVRQGKVKRIFLIDEGVEVILSISEKVKLFTDTKIIITEIGLMGERQIEIYPGKSKKLLDNSKKVNGIYISGFHENLSQISQTINHINKLLTIFENVFQNEQESKSIDKIIKNIDKLINNINGLFDDNNKFIVDFNKANSVIELFDTLIVKNKDKINNIVSLTNEQLVEMKYLLSKFKILAEHLEDKNTDFGRFTSSDSLYKKVIHVVNNLDSLVTDMQKNPKKYFRLF